MSGQVKIQGVRSNGNRLMIDPAKIKVIENYNVRDVFDPLNDAEDKSLLASIRATGLHWDKPLVVRIVGSNIHLIAGHRRHSAVMMARELGDKGFDEVACIPEGMGADGKIRTDAERTADLILSNTGKPLSTPEKGAVILRLRRLGWKDPVIAKHLGMTDRWVRGLAKVNDLDDRLRALVKANVIGLTLALETTSTLGKEGAANAALEAAKIAPKTGAKAGKVTGAGITAVTGKAGKADAQAARRALSKAPVVQTTPTKKGNGPVTVQSPNKVLTGYFTVGKDLDDCLIFEADGTELCQLATPEKARATLALLNQAWSVFSGKKPEPVTEPAKGKPVVVKELASIGTVIAGKASTAKTGKGASK